ncbi:MAG: MCE family protein [Bdellovibrionaceae bacterium]|nr:MCE family protein [Pseudobdellovibrionaceae bacterium]
MSFLGTTEFKVGALVVVVGGLIGLMSMQVSDDPTLFGSSKKRAWFLLDNAAGLIKNSGVKTAGIPIGTVKNISLQDGKARVDISVSSDIPLTTSAAVEIKSIGILGDKHVEVNPGSISDPPLPDGGQILIVRDKGSLDNVLQQVGDIAGSLKQVAEVVRESLSDDGSQKHVLGRIVKNIEQITVDIRDITGENKEQISEIVDQVNDITRTLDELINDESEEGLKKTWKKTLARLDSTMKNIDEVTTKINKGEGTIGKLINDESTVEELNSAITGISSLFDTAGKIQTGFDYHGEYLSSVGQTKSHIGIQIQPGLDRYYYLGIVDDPAGVVDREEATVSSGGSVISDTQTIKRYKNKTKFTAIFAKNFYDLTLKAGLIESTGGFGIDYHLFNRKLRFSVEAFNFERANLRVSARYDLFYGIYLMAGQQDILDKESARSSYLGAGLFLTNDDLKLLLTKSPF